MQNINNTLIDFIDAIKRNESLSLTREGSWCRRSFFNRFTIKLFRREERAKINFLEAFLFCLDRLEQIPVQFTSPPSPLFPLWLAAARAIELSFTRPTEKLKPYLTELRRRVIGLLYRLERRNGGVDKQEINLILLEKLSKVAEKWKLSQKIFWEAALSPRDFHKLQEASRYPEFVKLLLADETLCIPFFEWTLRDGIDCGPFIEFPSMQQLIVSSRLNGRIGRLGGEQIKVLRIRNEKHLTLKIEGSDISILDETKEIVLSGNYRLTIKQILEIFKNKNFHVGNLECFAEGIINWNTHCLGQWNPESELYKVIDLDEAKWWEQLPIFELLTIEEAVKRYGNHLNGKNWNLSAKASREYLTLNFDKTHAYLELAIPVESNYYAIYDFGKFATRFPANQWETAFTISVSVPATIAYPDENVFYTQRQHVGYSFCMTPEQGRKYMDSIKEDILLGREGNIVFQIESENCGKWIQTKLEEQLGKEKIPNLYQMPLVNAQPEGILKYGWQLIRLLPKGWQSRILALCHLPLGAWKGCWVVDKNYQKQWKSLTQSSYWRDGLVYLPAYLHEQHASGTLAAEASDHAYYFSSIKELKQTGIDIENDPFKSLDLFKKTGSD